MPVTALGPLLSLREVGCRYIVRHGFLGFRAYNALRDVSFDVFRGETLGLIGRNGSGKSTLLRLIAGVILPDTGTIKFHQPVSVSLMTLQLGFAPELSGRENALIGAMLLGYSRREAVERLGGIFEFADLGPWVDEPLKTYSSGMRARLGFAVAMEMTPDVLLVDEVLGVGDEQFVKKSRDTMKEKMRSGQTVVFVSHQPALVRELCTRVAWIDEGVTRMVGATESVLEAYLQRERTVESLLHKVN
jgi:lipopolysaccharide transport system ATP-binding protein